MKKENFDLQLFADGEPSAEPSGAAAEPAKTDDGKKADESAPKGGEAKYTDEDVDRLIDKKFAEWQKKQQKAVDEAAKLAEMNAQQKAEYERDQLKKELDALKRKDSLSEMTKTARKMLTDEGITVSDELLSILVTTEAEETKAAVDGFAKAFKEAVENAVKERLKGEPPRKGAGSATAMTKEQIRAIKDPELRQQKMLENRHLFGY